MPKIEIIGGNKLKGEIKISGSKNSVVALIPAAILCDEQVVINNVPNISDVNDLGDIFKYLGVDFFKDGETIRISNTNLENKTIPEEMANKLRASYYFMGVLLGKYRKVSMFFPGGCSIGERPINLHLKGFEKLGASVLDNNGNFLIEAKELVGNEIFLDIPSVGATINIILAAVKAKGRTIIENAAKEPHVMDVCEFLNSMGAKIDGVGTSRIIIDGVDYLHGTEYSVVPDMIEAGTYVIIASLLGEGLKISNLNPLHIESLTSKLEEAGVNLFVGKDFVEVKEVGEYNAIDVTTMVYPGFPTDLQQPLTPFLVRCNGISHIEETVWENRFMNIPDTVKMGASIQVSEDNKVATIYGKSDLVGKDVWATDLRGGASMVICGLIAEGVTDIYNIHYILRGYDDIVGKLSSVGASIKIVDE
ncbi:MAG: UDP-N-acetylglucosamine 1-carboxyvinyltransferase [Bacilli bacterium]|nr:UDP-N-acetylglucosamine 1-carboxyvinyltransferase [Bacilli bacterium]